MEKTWTTEQEEILSSVEEGGQNLVVEAVAGCLSGDTLIGINRAGKGFTITLERLVHSLNGGLTRTRRWDLSIPTRVRAPFKDKGSVQLATISRAVYSGDKETFRLILEDHELKGTSDHPILTPRGWVELGNLGEGDEVMVEASSMGPGRGVSTKKNYLSRVVPYHPHAVHRGRGNLSVATHRLNVEANMNGMDLESFVWKLQSTREGLKFLDPDLHVHHIDENHHNNGLSNLEVLTREEHLQRHEDSILANIQTRLVTERVVRIVPSGITATYDLTVPGVDAFIANGIAVHNSGKTSVLLEAAQRSKGKVLIQAYNRSIADELQSRLPKRSFGFGTMNYGPEVVADTAHSMGKQSLEAFLGGKLQVNGYKHADIVRDLVRRELRIYDDDQRKIAESSLKDLVSLCRLTLTNPNDEDAMKALCLHYGIEDPSMVQYVDTVLERGLTVFDEKKIIDFDDMVFLPGFLPSYSDRYRDFEMPKFDKVMTDESQDMNMAQLKCAMLMSKGQTICVGDRYQSIYGFHGADANMFEFIIQRLAARTLDMSICFRCPTSHLKIARKVVPQIKARDGAPVGTINHTETPDFINSEPLRAGDLILCRTNAPIISACVRLLKRGVKARIKGVELAARFNAILRKIAKYPGFSMNNFNYFVWNMWVREEKKRLKELNAGESRLSQVEDFALALISLHQNLSSQVNDVEGLCKALDAMFSLKDTEGVTWLSTVHKAKGLEAERVYILRPELIPLKFKGQQEWETTQEWNLFYVAHTRSKMNLTFVHKPEEV